MDTQEKEVDEEEGGERGTLQMVREELRRQCLLEREREKREGRRGEELVAQCQERREAIVSQEREVGELQVGKKLVIDHVKSFKFIALTISAMTLKLSRNVI